MKVIKYLMAALGLLFLAGSLFSALGPGSFIEALGSSSAELVSFGIARLAGALVVLVLALVAIKRGWLGRWSAVGVAIASLAVVGTVLALYVPIFAGGPDPVTELLDSDDTGQKALFVGGLLGVLAGVVAAIKPDTARA